MDIKIIEYGIVIKIKITINEVVFYSKEDFETEEEARIFLNEHELTEK